MFDNYKRKLRINDLVLIIFTNFLQRCSQLDKNIVTIRGALDMKKVFWDGHPL